MYVLIKLLHPFVLYIQFHLDLSLSRSRNTVQCKIEQQLKRNQGETKPLQSRYHTRTHISPCTPCGEESLASASDVLSKDNIKRTKSIRLAAPLNRPKSEHHSTTTWRGKCSEGRTKKSDFELFELTTEDARRPFRALGLGPLPSPC